MPVDQLEMNPRLVAITEHTFLETKEYDACPLKQPYRQKYKKSWEWEPDIRGWCTQFPSDQFSAYCKLCRSKLLAHKKSLIAHSKSTKHQKQVELTNTKQITVPVDYKEEALNAERRRRSLAVKKFHFNDSWLTEPMFNSWLRKVPNNLTKAFCVACRAILTAGRHELLKHSKANKHKRAITAGVSQEASTLDLDWLDCATSNSMDSNNETGFHSAADSDQGGAGVVVEIMDPNTMEVTSIVNARETIPRSSAAQYADGGESPGEQQPSQQHAPGQGGEAADAGATGHHGSNAGAGNGSGDGTNPPSGGAGGNGGGRPVEPSKDAQAPKPGQLLSAIMDQLNHQIPLHLAESWDNVGLLLQPSQPLTVHNILLTNDLTEPVLNEAIDRHANLIISYHPPIFRAMKALRPADWKERLVLRCAEQRIAIYSPHTALDALQGGLNDWLHSCVPTADVKPIQQSYRSTSDQHTNCLDLLMPEAEMLTQELSGLENVIMTVKGDAGGCDTRICCDDRTLPKVVEVLARHPVAQLCSRITKLQPPPMVGYGMGRICTLVEPLTFKRLVEMFKSHLALPHLRLALANNHHMTTKVKTMAVCAGSGASVLASVKADLLVTGEMSHHEVLDANHRGASVILTEHSNSERGYLPTLREMLKSTLDTGVRIMISKQDKDPLRVV